MMYNLIIELYLQHEKLHVQLLFNFKCFRFGVYDVFWFIALGVSIILSTPSAITIYKYIWNTFSQLRQTETNYKHRTSKSTLKISKN